MTPPLIPNRRSVGHGGTGIFGAATNLMEESACPANRKTEPVTGKSGKTRRASAATPPSIPGEKRVKETDASVPVGPSRRRRGTHDAPSEPAAIDHRKQFSGTDEAAHPERGNARRPSGGNAGRSAVGLTGKT